jgi:hypothetical protein
VAEQSQLRRAVRRMEEVRGGGEARCAAQMEMELPHDVDGWIKSCGRSNGQDRSQIKT